MNLQQLHPSTKLKILSLLQQENVTDSTTSSFSPPNASTLNKWSQELLHQFHSQGYYLQDGFIQDESVLQGATSEIHQLKEEHVLKLAGLGNADTKIVQEQIRGDYHTFLNENFFTSHSFPHLQQLYQKIQTLRHELNSQFGLQLYKDSVQVAFYPGNGTQFLKHSDASPLQSTERKITVILYLNKRETLQGGNLKLFPSQSAFPEWQHVYPNSNPSSVELEPLWNRLLIFPSDMYHQVLPSFSNRMALSCWFYSTQNIHPIMRQFLQQSIPTPQPIIPTFSEENRVEQQESVIFISICSYRDSELAWTIKDLFSKAKYRDRIRVGICWQYNPEKDLSTCFEAFHYMNQEYSSQISEIHLHFSKANGPIYARKLIQQYLFENLLKEGILIDFVLQIDSHMRFEQNWDVILIEQLQLAELQYPKCVLSTYPLGYTLPNELPSHPCVTLLCAKSFFVTETIAPNCQYIMPRFCGRIITQSISMPIPSLFYAAGFAFCRSQCYQETNIIGNYQYLFFGEELLYLKQLWKNGYRCFTPSKVIVYHLWSRNYRPTIFEDSKQNQLCIQTEESIVTNTCYGLIDTVYKNSPVTIRLVLDGVAQLSQQEMLQLKWKSCEQAMKELHVTVNTEENETEWKAFEEWIGIQFETRMVSNRARFGGNEHCKTQLL